MKSFIDLERTLAGQPPRLGALLARVDTGRGREQLSREQLPELLTALADETRFASITASSAIEGVVVERGRAERIAGAGAGTARRFRNRNERELAGYRDALDEMMRREAVDEPLRVPLLLHFHRLLFGHLGGGGGRLKGDDNLVVSYDGGRRTVIFRPPSPDETPYLLEELVARYEVARADGAAHPVVLVGAFVLDLLAIHPFADGNGRVARLATTHLLLREGYGVPRYVSLEQLIFDSKHRYYDVLQASQRGWHDSTHDVWPWITYLVDVLASAYERFEDQVAARDGAGLSKQARTRQHVIGHAGASFSIAELRRALPGVSSETIRLVLGQLRSEGLVRPTGRGRGARWERVLP